MTIGEKLKHLRKQHRMTLEDVANHINVGRATVLKYENGMITNIPSDKIEQLAVLFSVSPAYLMGWSSDSPDTPCPEDPSIRNPKIRLLASRMDKLPVEQQEQALEVFNAMYHKFFDHLEDEKK